ncbi:hypothetical protein KI387_044649, partial [Taxus chinensis]
MGWFTRDKIALGISRVQNSFFHHGCFPPIIHGGLSTSNVLLDEHFETHVAEAGIRDLLEGNRLNSISEVEESAKGSFSATVNSILKARGSTTMRSFISRPRELYIATKSFSKDEMLGSGGFGSVYRALLPNDGSIVAVKCVLERGYRRLEKSCEAGLEAVGQLRHKNLVSLKVLFFEEDEILLVYDYMPNSTLDTILFARKGPVLKRERSYKIFDRLAATLYYLHEQLE